MPISSWIGFEVALIEEQFAELGILHDPYMAFLSSLLYRFYPIVMIVFSFAVMVCVCVCVCVCVYT